MKARILKVAGVCAAVLLAPLPPSAAQSPLWVPAVPLAYQGFIYLDLFSDGGGYVLRNNGDGTYFLQTRDGGVSWLPATLPQDFWGRGAGGTDFASTQLGYASSCSGTCFFRTTDGTTNWEKLPAPSQGGIQMGVAEVRAAIGTDTIILGGSFRQPDDTRRAAVAISADRGEHFNVVDLGYLGIPYRMVFFDDQHGIVLGRRTGSTWIADTASVVEPDPDPDADPGQLRAREIFFSPNRALLSVGMQSPDRLFIGDSTSRLLRSDDRGESFAAVDFTGILPTPPGLEAAYWIEGIEFADAEVGYLSTAGHGIFRTDDGGINWTREVSPQEVLGIAIGGLAVADRDHALAGGRSTINRRIP